MNLLKSKSIQRNNQQQGQTLIETLVAAFVLVMGIAAALGLATYSLNATSNIRQQTVALGLAREGIEVVKNMRDTNWLRGTLSDDCYNFLDPNTQTVCYRDWLRTPYEIRPDAGPNFILNYDTQAVPPWSIARGDRNYGLDINPDTSGNGILYTPGTGNSGYFRKITIKEDSSFPPFDQESTGGRITVTSQVWWSDNKCPVREDINTGDPCSVTLETYLTNWRNF